MRSVYSMDPLLTQEDQMDLSMNDLSPKLRKEAEQEAEKIKRVADKSNAGGQLGGTFFGQEQDDGMAPPRSVAAGRS